MDLRDKTLTCQDCGRQFIFTTRDQRFYAEKGFTHTPGRCPECRAARKTSHSGKRRRDRRMTGAPVNIQLTRALATQTNGKNGNAYHDPDTNVLRAEVTELSYRCDVLSAEKAKLEREKTSLLEKVALLAHERDYLKNALAAFNGPVPILEKEEGLASRPWWKRIFG